jgi:hypothetical protein
LLALERCLKILTIMAYIARVAFVAISTITFSIALLAFSRHRNQKSAILTAGFGLFFVHGLISIPELFNPIYNIEFTDSWHLMLDALAILLILVGTLKD